MKYAQTRRSNEIPSYLGDIRLAEERKVRAEAKAEHSFRTAYKQGKMRTAQFIDNVDHIQHRLGVYEESDSGQIWHAHDDGFIYRDQDDVRDIVKAISESPDMTEEEYQAKIEELMSNN